MKIRILKYTLTLFLCVISFAAFSQTYYKSINTGNWSDNAIWDTPPPSPVTGDSLTISAGDTVTVSSGTNISISGNGTMLHIYGILIINGDLTLGNNKEGITIADGGMLIVLGDFTANDNKFNIAAGGYFYVAGQTHFNGAEGQKDITGPENIFFENPPTGGSYPGPGAGYSDCYKTTSPTITPCDLPPSVQDAVGGNCITVTPSSIDACISSDQLSFTFNLPDATNNCAGNLYYQVLDENGNVIQTYTVYDTSSAGQPVNISGNFTNQTYTYSLVFYKGSSTSDISGYKVVPIILSNTPTTGPIN